MFVGPRLSCLLVLGIQAVTGKPAFAQSALAGLRPSRESVTSATDDLFGGWASTLHLRDSTWRQVRVEVRVGPDRTCDALGSLGVQTLQQGQEWAVQFDDPVICWRRDQTPGDPTSAWTAWNRVTLATGETRTVTL